MLKANEIGTLKPKETGTTMLAVGHAEVRETTRKTHFLSLTLLDKTGSIKGKIWDWDKGAAPLEIGTVLEAQFEYSPFKGSPQIVVRDFRIVPKENVDSGLFVDSLSKEEFAHYRTMFDRLVDQIRDDALRGFVRFTLMEYYPSFFSSTGAKANHHARLGGLLEHTCHVACGALKLAESYKGTPKFDLIDLDLLIAGALLHDLAKIDTYTTENLVLDYSVQGSLISDYDLSPAYLREAYLAAGKPISELRMLGLQHILCSHHGKEFSNKPPSTFSAWLVHAADLADAYIDKVVSHVPEDGIMTNETVWSFGNRVFDERKLK